MKRRTEDPHRRFRDWLLAGADDELPRDVAVHAYVCAECQLATTAFDMLSATDPSLAGEPPVRSVAPAIRHPVRRVAMATGGAVAVTAVAVVATGALRLPANILLDGPASTTGELPTQEVLGNTGVPQPSPTPGEPSPRSSGRASATPMPPRATAAPNTLPPTLAPILTPAATPTPRPVASRTPRPSAATPAPTPSPPSPTPSPVEPTPSPTLTETPSPLP